jgi:hypothetical protein
MSLNSARQQCEELSQKVRAEAMQEADKRIDSSTSKIKKDIGKLQNGGADLHNRYDRALRELERVQRKSEFKNKDLRELKDLQEKPRGSVGNALKAQGHGLRRSSSTLGKPKTEGFHPLESSSDRMVLEIYRTLLLQRCGDISDVEIDQRFETLRSLTLPGNDEGDAAAARVSYPDFSRAVSRVISSMRKCNLAEAYRYMMSLQPMRSPRQGTSQDFHSCLKKALPLEDELHGHVCFLIDSALKMSRQASGKVVSSDVPITEEEFVDLFSDSRLGRREC